MKAILSADKNWGIGCGNRLLARVPEDMKFFKSATLGKVIIMGRKTFESLPGMNPLDNRINIVVTKSKSFEHGGVIVLYSAEEVLKETLKYEPDDVFIIGGGKIYKEFLPYCDEAWVTKWDREFEADTFFPNLDEDDGWQLSDEGEELNWKGMKYRHTVYKNNTVEEII